MATIRYMYKAIAEDLTMDLFDLIGPVMIGPSSSHTAGAARIGHTAWMLLGEDVAEAEIGLHGSFSKTYHGHGTDRAIVGGLLGMEVDDVRLRESLEMAEERGLKINFRTVNIRGAHPNTVRLDIRGVKGAELSMEASSVGGGNIQITSLNGIHVDFSGKENTLIIHSIDKPGLIANVSSCLAQQHVNIATMQVLRKSVGHDAMMVLELDGVPSDLMMMYLRALDDVLGVTFLKRRVA